MILVTQQNNKSVLRIGIRATDPRRRSLAIRQETESRRRWREEGLQGRHASLELHHIIDADPEMVHSDGMLVAFLPKEKILFQADFTLPAAGQTPNPFVQSLGKNLGRLKLDFDSYVSVHNNPAQQTRADLMKAVGITY